NGSGFAAGATVQFNGTNYPATGNSTQLSITVSAADLASSADPPVSVFNPGPGGGVSNVVTLVVTQAPGGSRLYLPLIAR
ncbi:MAG: cell shape-determining protein, partial [Chloroflexales bacterium]|nr:cell shape-determining protein [Chloroflexales bacterium]